MKRRRTSLVGGGAARVERARLPRELRKLCESRLDSVAFRRELRPRLRRFVRFDAYCVNTVDPETLIVTSSVGDGLSTAAASLLFEIEESGNDFNRLSDLARGPQHVATMVRATGGDVTRSARMRELFLPLGWHDELRAALVVDGRCWGYLHLFRHAEQPPFEASDGARISQLVPLLGQALRTACLLGKQPEPSHPPAVLLLDGQGALTKASDGSLDWLAALADDVGGAVPHVVHAVTSRSRARHDQGVSERAAVARYRTPQGDWLRVVARPISDGWALLLGSAGSRELSPLLFWAYGLTARECDVAALLVRGYANDAIAASLGISLHTTKDHVKAILAKTGSATRADFVATRVA